MTAHSRVITALVIAGATMTGLVFAQGGGTPAAPPAGQAPAPAPTSTPAPPAAPAGRGQVQAGPPQPGAQGGRRGGFPQYLRPIAPQDVLARGKALYETNCASCHATDLRGGPRGSNLLRSGMALNDKQGELVTLAISKHTPVLNIVQADSLAMAEYIHSIHATMGGQGSPPGRNPVGVTYNLLVGDAAAGQTKFGTFCSKCHSVTGDLAKIGSRFEDVRALQNAWVAGSSGRFGGAGGGGRGGGGAGAGAPAVVTLADGSKLQGTLVRQDDFLVVITLPDGTRKSMARVNGVPRVEVTDRQAAHKAMVLAIDDPNNQNMYDLTAYLWSVK